MECVLGSWHMDGVKNDKRPSERGLQLFFFFLEKL